MGALDFVECESLAVVLALIVYFCWFLLSPSAISEGSQFI